MSSIQVRNLYYSGYIEFFLEFFTSPCQIPTLRYLSIRIKNISFLNFFLYCSLLQAFRIRGLSKWTILVWSQQFLSCLLPLKWNILTKKEIHAVRIIHFRTKYWGGTHELLSFVGKNSEERKMTIIKKCNNWNENHVVLSWSFECLCFHLISLLSFQLLQFCIQFFSLKAFFREFIMVAISCLSSADWNIFILNFIHL